jgi:alcohol dehydrogenase class IV
MTFPETQSDKAIDMNDLSAAIEIVRPPRLEFGHGRAAEVGAWARAHGHRRVFVVTSAFNARRVDALQLDGDVAVFAGVGAEPEIPDLERALAAARQVAPDLIVGFGGGSVMDVAKLVAVLHEADQTFTDIVGVERARRRAVALAQVPTTAGTGSEVATRALVTDPLTRNKCAAQSSHMLADLAVIDPDLTITVPPRTTAETGVDAMAHCVEAFTNRKAHPMVDLYAREGIRLVGRYLARAVKDGADREARAGLTLAALYGGYCLGPVNTAGGHAVAYPLGTRHRIAHGAANAMIFPHVLAYNARAVPERTAFVLEALGLERSDDPDRVFAQGYAFCRDLGIPMRLSERGVPRDDIETMADEAFAIKRLIDNNPRPLTREAIIEMYERAY